MNRRILLIDDEPDIREVFKVSLEAVAGWQILTAGTGAEGAELAAQWRPDAIVLDVMMPELDGPATLEVLRGRRETRNIPVLFMTAKAQAGELSRIATLGVAGVIAKPFDPMSLHERIAGALGWD
ncbi:MAG TPA: response regulator [Solirubrobacteraceae bacterium]|nr:response regulator [Solirubrobacteraceae bacterium]